MLFVSFGNGSCQGTSSSSIATATLQTFPVRHPAPGEANLCPLSVAVDHLIGRLDGSTDDKDLAWLVDPTGRRVAVVWPEGFSVQFSPDVALFNEQRILVAQRGTVIEMTQVGRNDHSGTD